MIVRLPNMRERARALFARRPAPDTAAALVAATTDAWAAGDHNLQATSEDLDAFAYWLNAQTAE